MKLKIIFQYLSLFIFILMSFISCQTKAPTTSLENLNKYEQEKYTKQVQIAEAYAQETVTDREYNRMLKRLEGVFKYWIENFVSTKIYWDGYTIPRNMFFNKEKTKVLILVQHNYKERNKGVVKLICGQKIDGIWEFYDRGRPNFSYGFRGDRIENQPTLKELEYQTIQKLCDDGLVRRGKVSQKYINEKWF